MLLPASCMALPTASSLMPHVQQAELSSWIFYAPLVAPVMALAVNVALPFYQRAKRRRSIAKQRAARRERFGLATENSAVRGRVKHPDNYYRQWLARWCQQQQGALLPGGVAFESMDFTDLFVLPDVLLQGSTPTEQGGAVSFDTALSFAAESSRLLLLIGEDGGGKSALMQSLVLGNKPRLSGFSDKSQIFFLPLTALAAIPTPFPALPDVLREWSGLQEQLSTSFFHSHLTTHRTLVLLDGLDALHNPEQREAVCRWIAEAVGEWQKAFFVLTTSPDTFGEREQAALACHTRIAVLKQFNNQQQHLFFRQWFRALRLRELCREHGDVAECSLTTIERHELEAEVCADALEYSLQKVEPTLMREVAATPLLLGILARFWEEHHYVPTTREALYDAALTYLLKDAVQQPDCLHLLPPIAELKHLLGSLALWMQDSGVIAAPVEQVHAWLQPEVERLNARFGDAYRVDALCTHLAAGGSVLGQQGGAYLFTHNSFRDYLIGEQLLKEVGVEPTRAAKMAVQLGDGWWDEAFLFFAIRAEGLWFTRFLKALMESPQSELLDEAARGLLLRMVERADPPVTYLRDKLRDRRTNRVRQLLLLECLQVVGSVQAYQAAQEFIRHHRRADSEVLRKAAEVVIRQTSHRKIH
uniref:NACHT domain-containing protein n=1 Tax=Chlorobium chlorochromatii (strain CaD3) TaxID=340177 RepID=Q3AQ72_CHLCH